MTNLKISQLLQKQYPNNYRNVKSKTPQPPCQPVLQLLINTHKATHVPLLPERMQTSTSHWEAWDRQQQTTVCVWIFVNTINHSKSGNNLCSDLLLFIYFTLFQPVGHTCLTISAFLHLGELVLRKTRRGAAILKAQQPLSEGSEKDAFLCHLFSSHQTLTLLGYTCFSMTCTSGM